MGREATFLLCLILVLSCVPCYADVWARLQIFQPPLSRCCHGYIASIRWRTFSYPPVPEVGLVTWRQSHSGEEDVLDKAEGVLQRNVQQPGNETLRFAVESHDRAEVLAEVWVVLVVHPRASRSASWGMQSGSGQMNDPVVLHHALLPAIDPAGGAACRMECTDTASLEARRISAARWLTARHAASGKGAPEFVQIGANDGMVGNDPIRQHVAEDGWVGVLVEPLPDMWARLQATYAGARGLRFANVAVTDEEHRIGEDCTMLRVRGGEAGESWMDGLGSFFTDRSMIAGFGGAWGASAFADFKDLREWQPVICVTLRELFLDYEIQQLDAFVVDAEGYDARILKQLDLDRWRPALIVIEVVSVTDEELAEVVARLCAHGYGVVTDHLDLVALALEARSCSTNSNGEAEESFGVRITERGPVGPADPSLLPLHHRALKGDGDDSYAHGTITAQRDICTLSVAQHGGDESLVVRGTDGEMFDWTDEDLPVIMASCPHLFMLEYHSGDLQGIDESDEPEIAEAAVKYDAFISGFGPIDDEDGQLPKPNFDNLSWWDPDILLELVKNRAAWARREGGDALMFIAVMRDLQGRSGHYLKFPALIQALEMLNYNTATWMDLDGFVPLDQSPFRVGEGNRTCFPFTRCFLEGATEVVVVSNPIQGEEGIFYLLSGLMIFKNAEFAMKILTDIWQTSRDAFPADDQRALQHVLLSHAHEAGNLEYVGECADDVRGQEMYNYSCYEKILAKARGGQRMHRIDQHSAGLLPQLSVQPFCHSEASHVRLMCSCTEAEEFPYTPPCNKAASDVLLVHFGHNNVEKRFDEILHDNYHGAAV